MKFLLNMNIPRQLGQRLKEAGHPCRHVGDIGLAEASDLAIVEEARRQQEVILTHDLDYGPLIAFSGRSEPSVVIFRLRNVHPDRLFTRLMSSWQDVEQPLHDGAIVVIEDAAVRIRLLSPLE